MPDWNEPLKEFISKASPITVNIIVSVLGLMTIIFVGIIFWIVIKKIRNSFVKEETYDSLQNNYIQMSDIYRNVVDAYLKARNTTNVSMQFFRDISILICRHINGENMVVEATNLIHSIIYTIPHIIKSISGENHRCFLWIADPDNNSQLKNIAASTNNQQQPLSINNSFAGAIYTTGKERYSKDVNNETNNFELRGHSILNFSSLIGVPIKWNEQTVAVLTVDARQDDAFSQEDIDTLYIYGSMLSICLLILEQ